MGYVILMCECVSCHQPMSCNPNKVPSLTINGKRHALCKMCAERWIALHPETNTIIHPEAYAACDENEL